MEKDWKPHMDGTVTLTQGLTKLVNDLADSTSDRAVTTDSFGPLKFLVGTWRGEQSGEPGHGTAERTYSFVLNDRFVQMNNMSTYPPQEKNRTGETHHDMGMIGYDKARKKFVFR
jgi:hypothetical protein